MTICREFRVAGPIELAIRIVCASDLVDIDGAVDDAFQQRDLLLKHKDNKLFRKGALLNVIFVSDTHDPGRNEPSLITNRKNYAQLNALTNQYQDVRSLKFHAISPASKCSAEALHDFSYHALVDDSKGEKGDVCTLTDYSEYLKAMDRKSTV